MNRTSRGRNVANDCQYLYRDGPTRTVRAVRIIASALRSTSSSVVAHEETEIRIAGANQGIVEADGPAGHLEVFTVRLYNPQVHQWNIYFANKASGTLSLPVVGEFKNGRGEFYDQETYNDKAILVRFAISDITPTSCHFEQAFSPDGGKTWERNFIVTETLVKVESNKMP